MKLSFEEINKLNIKPEEWIFWVKEAFLMKYDCVLPHKISMKYYEDGFVNVMPSILPADGVYGVKVVSRNPNSVPKLKGDIFLFDINTSNHILSLDGTFITAMRTGAVAALTIETLAIENYSSVALIGLGNVGRAFLKCWISSIGNRKITLKLKKHNNHEQDVVEYLKKYSNITVELYDDMESFIRNSDVVISAITVAKSLLAEESWFKPGCLLVPVHTRGFQNCDGKFDMVECDDISHVEGFENFVQFKNLTELSEILLNKKPGRTSNKERILAYNIGISLHDIHCAKRIADKLNLQIEKKDSNEGESCWVF